MPKTTWNVYASGTVRRKPLGQVVAKTHNEALDIAEQRWRTVPFRDAPVLPKPILTRY